MIRPFANTGQQLCALGQGTWQMEYDDRNEVIRALQTGVEEGLTHIDTAEMYGSGTVEEIVGEAIQPIRDKVFLATKVLPGNASALGTIDACERSLRRLRTDVIDLYLLHWPGSHPLSDTLEAFAKLKKQGKIRAFGVSNFDADELAEAVRLAGRGEIACNQVLYHLEERAIEHAVLPQCEALGVELVGYSPFGSGQFPREGSSGRAVLDELAAAKGATSYQIALAFLLRRPSLWTIPKAARSVHVKDNVGALEIALSEQELARIDTAFPLGRPSTTLPMI